MLGAHVLLSWDKVRLNVWIVNLKDKKKNFLVSYCKIMFYTSIIVIIVYDRGLHNLIVESGRSTPVYNDTALTYFT